MGKPVLIDFYADWCGPCRIQTPILEELARRMGDQIEVKKINVDDNMDLANKYRIYVVPTLIIEKDQREIRRIEGLTDVSSLEAMIKPLMEKP
jgi:thioredoxin 1